MNTSQAEQVLNSYLQSNNAQIRDINTHQVVVRAMHYFAALAVSEAKNENIAMIKAIKDENILLHTQAYLGEGDASIYFTAGVMWMKEKILEML